MSSSDQERTRIRLLEVQSWLAEYEALQNEKANSQRQRGMLIETAIIALGVIVGLGATVKIYPFTLFLTLSILCSCLGLLWVHENRRSLAYARYIINKIAPALRELTGEEQILGAESYKYGDSYEVNKVLGNFLGKSVSSEDSPSPDKSNRQSAPKRSFAQAAQTGLQGLSRGGITEFLIFLIPSIVGVLIGFYGWISPEPWYWYGTLLFILALILANALVIMGWKWYKEWYIEAPSPEEALAEEKSPTDAQL